ncbi:MAG TPA: hypothetical protein VKE49_00895 [Myxococcaceae bacterium]|nr:hypothetical protein [Myxococcaceae bacterium]
MARRLHKFLQRKQAELGSGLARDPIIGGIMIDVVLTVGFGAVATAIGFGLSRRARDMEWRSDGWDRAGALMKILGAFVVMLGFALLVQSSRSPVAHPNAVIDPGIAARVPASATNAR